LSRKHRSHIGATVKDEVEVKILSQVDPIGFQ